MKKNFLLTLVLLLLAIFTAQPTAAQAPVASPEQAITALLNRIGGSGAADKFEIVINASLAENGKDVFVITAQNGKPCIKGNNQLSVATGINWYLNHVAHINLTWNNLTTDLVNVELPVPTGEDKHVCNTTYRYDFNTCTFSYSMAFWTWERWQKEIDWMALHGINAPLNLVGLDVVTRNFLKELGMSDSDIAAYIAGPGFIAWFAMNNLEGWGGTINSPSTGVDMSGNPEWWYTRQEQLCKNMLQRMRELGMQPVIPGFSGQIPNSLSNYTITGFSSGDVINGGTWAGGYTRPDILHPNSSSYATLAPIYYKHLEAIMGVSEFYSMDPFHEGGLPSAVTNETCYPPIMAALDTYHNAVEDATKTSYKVSTEDNQAKWIIQYWQNIPQSGAFSSMSSYGDRFIGLDLFSDNIYAGNAAKWRGTGNDCYYQGRPYIYCMLHNFGGRSGLHGRLETTMDGYFEALAKNNNCQGIGATPEGTETNPILYDMLFELPWMDVNSRPTADEWLEEYTYSRYGVSAETVPNALAALQNLKKSVWNCEVNQQGTSEAVILARPAWTVNNVSSWSTSAIYWDTQDVLLAADQLYSVKDLVTANGGQDGIANYNYDFIDVIRQAMVDYAAQLLPLIKAAYDGKNTDEYTRLYQLYLQLMLDLDTMLSYDENFKLERWTSLARNIADEVTGTTENDRNWLEWNARTQVTVWSKGNTDLHDYSNRCWAGLIKDFHYKRWEKFFTTNGGSFDGGWFSGFEYPWTVDFNDTYNLAGDYSEVVIPTDMTATAKAAETFGKYFGRVKGATKNYIFPMGVATNATKSDAIPEVYRGQTVKLPLIIGKEVTVSSVQIDLNGDGAISNTEALTADGMNVTIPADAAIGKTKAIVEFSDGTVITFNLAIIVDITADRTVTAATADANMGTVAIEGTNELTITNMAAVKITATANTGYNFKNWTDAGGNVVSNDNPYIYYGETDASFTANFIQDKWGVVECNGTFSGDIASYKQFIHNLTFAYYNREAETILEATTAPTQIFNTVPQIIDVPQGASFDVYYDDGDGTGLQYCYFRAYIDLNADGDFDDEGELLKEVGTNGATNTAVCSNTMNVILPYDAPLGITHMRLRFDGAWDNSSNPSGRGAKDASIRPVYEIIINVTDKSDKAAHITVKTNSDDWGTAEVWTDETPDGSTGTEWDVSSNIPLYLRATKSTEDTDFLGWYDHYGRLLTTEPVYTMYAREDATYTAKFRKLLDIDGWQFEYRTEPGTVAKTNKLANGVKPENGKTYYIYAPTRPTNDGDYVNRYLYNNNGTLSLNTTASGDNYLWTCSVDGENYTFQNVGDPAKYLAHKATAASPYNFKLGTGATQYEGITIYSVADGKFLVTKDNGTGFDQSTRAHNQSTEDFTTDYVFTEVSYPDNVILTNVRKSGDHDLVIPETVEILGEQCKIVGFDNGLFADNKDLWTISLPATIETMSNNRVFKAAISGKGANASADASNYITTDLGTTLAAGEDWSISLTIEDNGNNFNEWGSALIATGNKPMEDTYTKGFQLYMKADGTLIVKLDYQGDGNALTSISKGTKYRIDVVYTHSNTQLVVTATSLETPAAIAASRSAAARTTNSLTLTQDMSGFSTVSHAIPEGVNITNLQVNKGAVPDPFEGCTNLVKMTVDDENENYYVDSNTRTLYTTGNTDLHAIADEVQDKEDEIRALGGLIDLTEALIEEVALSVNPTGKATEIALTTTQGENGYIWCNAPQSGDEGNVGNLFDGNGGTFFHSNWGSTTPPDDGLDHHLTIELGEGKAISDFSFHYQARSGDGLGDYPTTIKVQGSNNGTDYTDIAIVEPRNSNDGTIQNGAEWTSGVIGDGNKYTYLRFMVTATTTDKKKDGHIYFHMAEFDLYDLTATAEVAPKYKNLAGVTNEETAEVYDRLAEALYVYNNGGTADELQAAYDALGPLYTALNAKKDKVFEGVYNINFNGVPVFVAYLQGVNDLAGANNGAYRLFDGALAHDGAPDGNTDEGHKALHQSAIDAKVAADELFMIVPNSEFSGYTLSAQGLYLENTYNGWWGASAFNTDKEQAGVYLFEETETDIYRLKCNERNSLQYINDWGYVFGNNDLNETYSTFTFTKVTEYTLTVPESGFTTLCLPFNVVLPAGVTAYDLAEANITTTKRYSTYELVTVASEGETLAKNTPVIIKAAADDYTLTITMNDEGAKGSTEGTLLRSGLVKTTIAAGNRYIFDGENFNRVNAETAIAANECWLETSENLGGKIYGTAPDYVLTTDEDNPVLYKIFIKRTADVTVLQYDEASKKIAVANKADNKSYQAWYFMQGENGILIKPFNADGKMLGANDTGNGAGRVSAAEEGKMTYNEWTLVKRGNDGYYNITTNGAYFSNYGGTTNKMGFWDGDANESKTQTDGGSLFKFVDAEFENDNARYYQLKDVAEYLNDGSNFHIGTSVGLYDITDYTVKYNEAKTLVDAGSGSDANECHDAYTALRNVPVNVADPAKIYYIKSAATNDNCAYCTGKYVHTNSEPQTRGTITANHETLVFDAAADISMKSLAAFQLVAVEGGYKIKNLHTDLYVKSFKADAGTTHMGAEADAAVVKVAAYADGQVTLQIGNNSPMHAQENCGVIVEYGADAGNASLWTIDEAEISDLNHTVTIPSAGYTTLYLPFNVTLPEGVEAYTVYPSGIIGKGNGEYGYVMTRVAEAGDKLAKGTAVIIKGTPDAEYTFEATLDDTDAITVPSSALRGTYIEKAVNSNETAKAYLLGAENGEAVFNRINADTNIPAVSCWLEAGADDEQIDKYIPAEITDGNVYRIKGLLSNGKVRTLYNNGANSNIKWTEEEKTDASTLFIVKEDEEESGKYYLISALANGVWNNERKIAEEGVALTFAAGSVAHARMIVGNNNRRFAVPETSGEVNFYSNCTAPANEFVTESNSTDFLFESVDASDAKYGLKMKKSYEWSTLYLPYSVKVPSGVKAYIATGVPVDDGSGQKVLILTEAVDIVPAYTAVIIKRESSVAAETFNLVYTTEAATTDVSGNLLKGRITEGYVGGNDMASKNFYILFRGDEGERMYWIYKEFNADGEYVGEVTGTHIKCAGNKAYLALDAVNNAPSLSFRFSGTTEIEEVKGEYGNVKAIYDLQGRKLSEITEPGIYIIDGKKVLVK
ncbi:MAG: alpha-N-acetylglucosaminidase C-terminal domain-containing protein [Bacteroidaceae bacterium]|nr:alpha-N-acetylglucosaminidase C-terminal domain-containing protein [Bacteroidaceae bacterium]